MASYARQLATSLSKAAAPFTIVLVTHLKVTCQTELTKAYGHYFEISVLFFVNSL